MSDINIALVHPFTRSPLHRFTLHKCSDSRPRTGEIWYNRRVVGVCALTIKKPQTTTLIDTFSEGYAAINRRPWLVLVPILLNLYLWFGAHLSFGPLIADLHMAMRRLEGGTAEESELRAQYTDQLLALGQVDMRQQIAVLNFIPTLTTNVVTSVDSGDGSQGFPMIQSVPQLIDTQRTDTIKVSSVPGALLAFLLLNTLVLPLSAVFLTLVAAAVRSDR